MSVCSVSAKLVIAPQAGKKLLGTLPLANSFKESVGDKTPMRGALSFKRFNMRKLPTLFTAAALSGLALFAVPSSAGPLASGLTTGSAATSLMDDGLVQKVHRWHCRKRFGWYRGHKRWHRHRRACYDDDYGYYQPGYSYGYGVPFFAFSFDDDDDNHHRRRFHRRRHKDWND